MRFGLIDRKVFRISAGLEFRNDISTVVELGDFVFALQLVARVTDGHPDVSAFPGYANAAEPATDFECRDDSIVAGIDYSNRSVAFVSDVSKRPGRFAQASRKAADADQHGCQQLLTSVHSSSFRGRSSSTLHNSRGCSQSERSNISHGIREPSACLAPSARRIARPIVRADSRSRNA